MRKENRRITGVTDGGLTESGQWKDEGENEKFPKGSWRDDCLMN